MRARRKRTRKATTAELIDWRIGHHIEAAAKLVSASFDRIAAALVESNALQLQELAIRREHLLSVLESKAMADKAAQKIMGLMPDLGMRVHDLRGDFKSSEEVRGPEWIKDVLADTDTHTDRH